MKVSIIIPVYNCSKYITHCIDSVLEQSYGDWELLIIDDGSTDDSAKICKRYSEQDERIRYYYQENQGQGIARGFGLKEARGEYIAFLDADDWWDVNTLSELQHYVQANQVDLVLFDYIIFDDIEGIIKRIDKAAVSLEAVTNTDEHPELFYTLKGSIWDKFYHKSLWEGIKQPGHPYEDSAVLPMVLAKARRIGQIQKPLYYYREGRYDSTVNRTDTVSYLLDSMQDIKSYFTRNVIFDKYQEPLRRYSEWMYFVMKNHAHRVSMKDITTEHYNDLFISCEKFLAETYPLHTKLFQLNYLVWGSYNLRCMHNRGHRNLQGPKSHYSFSSIISIMAPKGHKMIAVNNNPYRAGMIQAEMNREFCNLPEKEYASIDYICIDFLEERFPVVTLNDNILTLSDALAETGVQSKLLADPLSPEYLEMWKINALALIDFLKKKWRPEQIILVKNYLCEGYGSYGIEHCYPEVDAIRKQNLIINEYYNFFEEHFNGIKVIANERADLEFTDVDHSHGCYPWHQNEFLYYAIADKMEEYVIENERIRNAKTIVQGD